MKNLSVPDERFINYLTYHWLSPGTAFQLYFMSNDVRELSLHPPIADISCGTGTFMFMALGGKLKKDLTWLGLRTRVERRAEIQVDVGTDLNPESLKQTRKLKLYKKLVQHDNNKVPLPFSDEQFRTIYCNAIYWLKDPLTFLQELYRIMHYEGKGLFHVMTPALIQPYDDLKEYFNSDQLDKLNRFKNNFFDGELVWPQEYTYEDWKAVIEKSGFSIAKVKPAMPNQWINYFMNIEFRLVLPELKRAFYSPGIKRLASLRKSWVAKIGDFIWPLKDVEPRYTLETAPYLAFFVKKRKS